MRYEEFRPAEPLSRLIKCIWVMEGPADSAAGTERIVPDGCMEIVFNLADPFEQHNSDRSTERQPLALLVGQMQRPLLIAPTGSVRLIGVRFWPGGAYYFVTLPQHEIAGQIINLEAVWGGLARELQSRIADATTTLESVRLLNTMLLARLKLHNGHDDPVLAATALILSSGGRLSIDKLANSIGLSSRTLDRRFNIRVGLSPKALCRLVRFQRVFRLIEYNGGVGDWAQLALDCGYYDQSHFIKEFKVFAGTEPTSYFSKPNVMSDHFTGSS